MMRTASVWRVPVFAFLALVVVCYSGVAVGDTVRSFDPSSTYGGHSWGEAAIASKLTMPSTASAYRLETLEILIAYTSGGNSFPVDVSLWEDNGSGEPGALLWSEASQVAATMYVLNDFDVSGSGIVLSPGQSIFAGYTTADVWDIAPRWQTNPQVGGSFEKNNSLADSWHPTADRVMLLHMAAIPEPVTMCALGLAVAGLGGYVRKRRKA